MKPSLGSAVIFTLALATAVIVALLPDDEPGGIPFWVFTGPNREAYTEPIAQWNEAHPETPFVMSLLHDSAIERRMISGFLTGSPMADLLETHEIIYPKAYLGPIEQIGFLDITDRLHEEVQRSLAFTTSPLRPLLRIAPRRHTRPARLSR